MLVESFSGIRGIYNKGLSEDVARRYAYAFISYLKKKDPRIVIGIDTRPSSEPLKKAIFDVLPNIIDVGIASTPMTELAVRSYKADGGIIITASHNEPEYNGFKFLDKDGAVLRPNQIDEVIGNFHKVKDLKEREFLDILYKDSNSHIHNVIKKDNDIKKQYYNFILKIFNKKDIESIKKSGCKVVIDPNGGTAIDSIDILKKLGIDVVAVNNEYGVFKRVIEPNHDSLKYLKEIIKKNDADIGAGFDCDADRVEIALPNGDIISGQYLLALAVDDILSEIKNPEKQTIVINDATSGIIREIAAKYKTAVVEKEVGEINVVDAMIRYKSPIAGEGSSSGVILPPSMCRDGTITLLSILKIISKKNKQLQEIIKEYPIYYTLREKLEFHEDYPSLKKKIKETYSKKGFEIQETGGIDGGLKILKQGSYLWFRTSKTEHGALRLISDSKSKDRALALLEEGKRFINA